MRPFSLARITARNRAFSVPRVTVATKARDFIVFARGAQSLGIADPSLRIDCGGLGLPLAAQKFTTFHAINGRLPLQGLALPMEALRWARIARVISAPDLIS